MKEEEDIAVGEGGRGRRKRMWGEGKEKQEGYGKWARKRKREVVVVSHQNVAIFQFPLRLFLFPKATSDKSSHFSWCYWRLFWHFGDQHESTLYLLSVSTEYCRKPLPKPRSSPDHEPGRLGRGPGASSSQGPPGSGS